MMWRKRCASLSNHRAGVSRGASVFSHRPDERKGKGLAPERNHFPGLNSRMEGPTPHYTPINFNSVYQADKIHMTGLGESTASKLAYQPAYRNLIVRWIPDTRHRFLQREKPPAKTCIPSQRMSVKDLALEILQSFKDSEETHFPKLEKRKKSNKVPTGGQPYLLHLRRNPKIPPNKSSSPTRKERKPVESPAGKRKFLPPYLQVCPLGDVQRKDAVHVENKKNALPGSKEMETYPLIVQKVPVNERGLGRIQSQLKLALEGPGNRVPKHPLATPAQRLNSTTSTLLTSEAHSQRRKGEDLPQEASAEKVPLPECSPRTSQVDIDRKKPPLKYVEYKSNTASFFMEGYDSYVHQISKTFNEYCKNIAIRKKAALTLESSESRIRETACKSEKNGVQSQNPPPPPPTPLTWEFSDNTQDLTCS